MINKRIVLQMLTLSGLALVAMVLTMTIPALVQAAGSITIDIEADQVVKIGGTATFSVTVTNNGTITLTGVTVETNDLDDDCDTSLGTLNPGASAATYSCSHSGVTQSFDNTATASGTPEGSGTPVDDNDTVAVTVADIDFEKTTDTPTVVVGSDVDFTLTLENTGDAGLTVSNLSDPECGETPTLSGGDDNLNSVLDKDETWTYTCTVDDIATDFTTNVATVTVTTGTVQIEESDSAAVDVLPPSIDFKKTTDTPTVVIGSDVDFTLTLTNTSNVVTLTVSPPYDPKCDEGPTYFGGDYDPMGVLDTDEIWTYTCTVDGDKVTTDFTNKATVTLTTVTDFETNASAEADVNVVVPGITIVKGSNQVVDSGNDATFNIMVSNDGYVTLTNVSVTDAQSPDCNRPNFTANLNPGVSLSYACVHTDVTESLINSATTSGTPDGTSDLVSDSDAATVILSSVDNICPAYMTAYWKLDEGNTPPSYEDFYSAHDGQYTGQYPTSLSPGRVKDAQTFDGANTGINIEAIPGDESFNWAKDDSFSIELWMKGVPGETCLGDGPPYDNDDNEVIIGRDDHSNSKLHWWLGCRHETGVALFDLSDIKSNFAPTLISSSPINDGEWHYLVAVRDGTNKINRLYVDGTEVASTTYSYSAGFGSDSAALNIGWLNLSGGFHFEGDIDEVAVYNKVLSTSEIDEHYNDGLGDAAPDYCEGLYPPTILSTPVLSGEVNTTYVYDVAAIGNPAPTYTLTTAPTGMTIDSVTGLISWTPTTDQGNKSHAVEVAAINSQGTHTQPFDIGIGKFAPIFYELDPVPAAVTGKLFIYTVQAYSNPSEIVYTLLSPYPDGMEIDQDTGVISWTPAAGQQGNHTIKVQASNGIESPTTSPDITIKVSLGADDILKPTYLPTIIKNN